MNIFVFQVVVIRGFSSAFRGRMVSASIASIDGWTGTLVSGNTHNKHRARAGKKETMIGRIIFEVAILPPCRIWNVSFPDFLTLAITAELQKHITENAENMSVML